MRALLAAWMVIFAHQGEELVIVLPAVMLAFGQPLDASVSLPLVAGWLIAGVTFVWWFDRFLSRRDR